MNPSDESQKCFPETAFSNTPGHVQAKMHSIPEGGLSSLQEHSSSQNGSDHIVSINKLQSRGQVLQHICPEPLRSCSKIHHFLLEYISTSHTKSLVLPIHKDTPKPFWNIRKRAQIAASQLTAKSCGSLQRPHGLVIALHAHKFVSLGPIPPNLVTYLKRSRRGA